jgi:putative FmdB family regulatory protein
MPIYEYRCVACKQDFEVFQWINEKPLTYCDLCRAPGVKKLVSCPAPPQGEGLPSSTIRKENEDAAIFDIATKARRMKAHGKMKMEEKPTFKEVQKTYKHPLPPVRAAKNHGKR